MNQGGLQTDLILTDSVSSETFEQSFTMNAKIILPINSEAAELWAVFGLEGQLAIM